MSNIYGYEFYFKDGSDVLTFPITPGELNITVGSNNKVVTLINEGDINILKSPSLIEIEFEARFPMRDYPYSRNASNFQTYMDKFTELKEKKKAFRFIVARSTPNGKRTWDTNLLVALEKFEVKETADEGDDVLVSFELKQYKEYGVKKLDSSQYSVANTFENNTRNTEGKGSNSTTYTVKPGDCLWNISKAFYGDATKWTAIYQTNKTVIEATAKKYGKSSSSNGHWIYPGTKLIIPDANTATATVEKLNNSKSSSNSNSNSSANGAGSSRSWEAPKTYKVTISSNGINAYTGSIGISYTSNRVKKTVNGNTTLVVYPDENTSVMVVVTAREKCGAVLSNFIGNWTKSGLNGSTTRTYAKCYTTSIKKNMSFTVKWVK